MRDIAEAAGVNEALIYQHFRSKEDLFEAAVVFPLEGMVVRIHGAAVDLALEATGALERELTFRFVRDLLAALQESIVLFGVVIFSDQDAGAVFYRERMVPVFDLVTEAVQQHSSRWTHRTFDPRRMTMAVWGMCWGLAMDAHLRDKPLDLTRVANEITDLAFFGLFSETSSDALAISGPAST
jgi:AcrR family transcriptional regulator